MQKIIVFSGSGISAESGLKTFRDNNGLWENHSVYDVATPEAWHKNPELVLEFYNQRRRQLLEVEPNIAHKIIADLEQDFDIQIITQNVDDLHERSGSTKVLHLHGELRKARSTVDENLIVELSGRDLHKGDLCPLGSQLRPHVVWFGEAVPAFDEAVGLLKDIDQFWVIGSSLAVYPAASLLNYLDPGVKLVLMDPSDSFDMVKGSFQHIQEKASLGMKILKDQLYQ